MEYISLVKYFFWPLLFVLQSYIDREQNTMQNPLLPSFFLLSSSFLADPRTHHHFIFQVYSIIWLKIGIWILLIQNNLIHKRMALLDNFSIRKLEANTFYLHFLSSQLSSSFSWSMTPHLVYKIKQGHKNVVAQCTSSGLVSSPKAS